MSVEPVFFIIALGGSIAIFILSSVFMILIDVKLIRQHNAGRLNLKHWLKRRSIFKNADFQSNSYPLYVIRRRLVWTGNLAFVAGIAVIFVLDYR